MRLWGGNRFAFDEIPQLSFPSNGNYTDVSMFATTVAVDASCRSGKKELGEAISNSGG